MVAIFGINGSNSHASIKQFSVGHQTAPGQQKRHKQPSGQSLITINAGKGVDAMAVDVASGNLIVQDTDGLLVSRGDDVVVTRTYNSQGRFTDGNHDLWWMNAAVRLKNFSGKANTAGSTVQRVGTGGVATTYTYDVASDRYVAAAGSGQNDTMRYDAATRQWTWTDAEAQHVEVYEASGAEWRLASSIDANGNASTYTYEGNLLASITAASGEKVEFTYSDNLLTREAIREADGSYRSCTEYRYDEKGRLTQTRVDLSPDDNSTADGNVYLTSYSYLSNTGLVTSVTQGDGSQVKLSYETAGGVTRIATVTDALGRVTSFSYDTATHTTTVTDALGNKSVYSYDGNNNLVKLVGPAVDGISEQVTYEYDTAGHVVRTTNGVGYEVRYTYDSNGNQLTETDSLGNRAERTYDSGNRILTETVYRVPGEGGRAAEVAETTRYVYDAKGNLRFLIDAQGGVTEHRYDGYGQNVVTLKYAQDTYDVSGLAAAGTPSLPEMASWALSVDPALAARIEHQYNNRGQVVNTTTFERLNADGSGIRDGSESTTSYVYDVVGNLLLKVDPNKQQTSYVYDGLNRLLSSTDALGRATTHHYDDFNHTVSHTHANGRVDIDVYDAAGELVSSLKGGVARTQYRYDALGHVIETTDPTGVKTRFVYNAAGDLAAEIDGDGGVTQYFYNAAGDRVQTVRRAIALTGAQLSALESSPALLAGLVQGSAGDQASYALYDGAGRLVKEIDAAGYVTEHRYDGADNRIATIRYATAANTSALGATSGPEDVQVTPSARDRITRFYFDNNNRETGVVDADGYVTEYRYDAAGRRTESVRYANPLATPVAAASFELAVPAPSAADQHTYTLYDGEGQVTGTVDAEGYLTEQAFDANGNIVRSVRYANRVTVAAAAGMTVSDVRHAADPNDQVTVKTYDPLGRLSSTTNYEGTRTEYAYDLGGNLVSTVAAAGTGEMRRIDQRFDVLGRVTAVLSPLGASLLAGAASPAQVEEIWNRYGTKYTYDAAGRQASSTDPNGNRTLYYYDRTGDLTHIVNALGEVQEARYDAQGRPVVVIRYGTRLPSLAGLNGGLVDVTLTSAIAGIADVAKDSVIRGAYDKKGQLVLFADELGGRTTYAYNGFGETVQSVTEIDAGRTLVEEAQYDRRGNQVLAASNGVTMTREYDAFGRVVRAVDGNGNATDVAYDRLGRMVTVVDPTNARRQSSYDAFGRQLTQTDANGNTTRYTYDSAARTVTMHTAEGVSVTVAKDRHGQTQRVTDGDGNVTTYHYDLNGNLLRTDAPLTQTGNKYDAADRLIESRDANGNLVRYTYDAANRVLSRTVDPDGLALVTSYQYDAKGQQVASIAADGVVTRTRFDLKGQVVEQVVDPDGLALRTSFSYDQRGKVLTVTNPAGVVTQYVYDAQGRRVEERLDPAGLNQLTRYSYDGNDNVVSVTDALGNMTRYAYDGANRLVYVVDGAGSVHKNSYDGEGHLVASVAFASRVPTAGLGASVTVGEIDALVSAAPGQDAGEYRVYDKDGRVSYTVDGAGGVTRYSYDGRGNVVERVRYANRIDMRSWTPGAEPAVVTDAAHDVRVRVVYDAQGRAVYSIDGTGAVTAMKYDGNGNVVETLAYAVRVPAGTPATAAAIEAAIVTDAGRDQRVRQVFDSANRMTWSVDGRGAVTRYVYDDAGNVVKRVEYANLIAADAEPGSVSANPADRVTLAAYDNAGRLVYQVDPRGTVTKQVYDANGRVTQRTVFRAPVAAPTAAAAVVGIAGFDAMVAGLDSVSIAYRYDALGRVLSSTDPTGVQQQFIYDANGRLVAEVDGSGRVTQHVYNAAGQQVQVIRRAVALSPAQLAAVRERPASIAAVVQDNAADQVSFTVYDGTGKVAFAVDAAGSVTGYRYDGAGNRVAATQYATLLDTSTLGIGSRAQDVGVLASEGDRTTHYYFGNNQQPIGTIDAEGYVTEYRYDAAGRQVEAVRYAAPVDSVPATGDEFAALIPAGSGDDQHSFTLYDGQGRVIGLVDAEGYLTEQSYDADGNVVRSVRYANQVRVRTAGASLSDLRPAPSAADQVTVRAYDGFNRLVSESNHEGTRTEYAYDANGNVTAAVAAAGTAEARTTRQQYDALGQVTEVKSGANGATYTYDAAGRRTSSTDANGNRTLYYYNRSGELTHTINALGEVEERRYDALGEQVAQVRYGTRLPSLAGLNGGLVDEALLAALAGIADATKDSVSAASYGKNGQVAVATDALGGTTQYAYDAFGELGQRTTSIDGSHALVETVQYDKRGELVAQTTGGVTAKREYDAFGRVVRSVDGNGNATTQDYDKLGHVVTVTDPTHAVRKSSYDAFGRVLTQTDATGNTTSYAYDDAARSVTLTTAEGVTMTVEHDRHGQTQRVTDGNGNVTSYSYDANGKLVETGNALGHSRNVYDAAGRLTESVDANGNVVRYSYDAANRLLSRTVDPDGLALTTSYQYDAKGEQVAVTDANGVVTTTRYDLKGQVVEQVVDPAGLALSTRYSYDQRGQVLTVTNPGGVVTQYVYDDKGRRIEEHVDPAGLNQTHRYAYDNNGNVVAVADALGNVSRYAYDADNRLVYAVDGAGNVKQTSYDAAGRVVSAIQYAKAISLDGLGQQASVAEIAARVSATPGQDAGERRVYDKDGRVRYTIDGAGGVTRYSYDGKGNVTERVAYANRIDMNAWVPGTAPAVVVDAVRDVRVRAVYDANDRVIYQIDGTGAVRSIKYDGNGNVLETVVHANRIAIDTPATASAVAAALVADLVRDQRLLQRFDSADRLVESSDSSGVEQQYVYDRMGRLLAQVDGGGRVTQYAYNAAGERVQVVRRAVPLTKTQMDALEADHSALAGMIQENAADQISYSLYDELGRVAVEVDAGGFVTQNRFDAAGNLVATTRHAVAVDARALGASSRPQDVHPTVSPDDRTSYFYYDSNNRPLGMVDAEGYVTAYRYDAAGRQVEAVRYANRTSGTPVVGGSFAALAPAAGSADQHSYTLYDGEGRVTGTVDAEGYLTERSYDADGNVVRSVRYANRVAGSVNAGSSVGEIRPAASSRDQVTTQEFDALGRKVSSTNAEGTRTEYTYDANGNVTAAVAAAGTAEARTTRQQYDALGQVTEVKSGANGATYTYDAAGRRTSSTDANGNRTLYYYNRSGELTHTINALGEVEERRYDALGEQVAQVRYGTRLASLAGLNGGLVDDALLAALAGIADATKDSVSTASYGKNGQVLVATDALGGTTQYAYDAFGEEISRTQGIDGSRVLTQSSQYDKRGELVAQTTGGVTAKREYDAFGRVVRSVDGNGNATTQDYDKLGHVVTVTDPTHAVRKSSYDAFGRVLTQTDATGNTTSYAYDDAARSVTLTTAEGVTMTVEHDRHGQTQRVTDGNGNVTSYSYDANGKLVETGNGLGHSRNVYDAAGRLTESVDANGNVVRYSYDAANRLLSRTVDPDGLALTTSYQYDAKGEQVAVTDANGVVTTTRYDLKGQMVEQVVDPAGLALSTRYSYDGRGQVLTVTNPGGVVTQYVYDDKGRRIEEHVDPAGLNQTRRYAYDNNGNVVAVTDALGNVSRYAYDADNRLVYAVDGAGNVKQTGYDAAGRVVSAIQYAKAIALDGLGQQASVAEIAARVSATPGQDAGERRVYDKDGRVRYTIDGAGGVTRYSYDGKGNVTERVAYANRIDLNAWVPGTAPAVFEDPSRDLRLRMVYDANNRAIYSIDGTGAVSARKYDANGNVVETIAYANRVPVSTAASAAAIEAALVADGARDTHVRNTYDSANRLAWSVDGTGSVTQNVYDKDGNLVKRVQYAKEIAQGADPRSVTPARATG